jgi:hypothetical protein
MKMVSKALVDNKNISQLSPFRELSYLGKNYKNLIIKPFIFNIEEMTGCVIEVL